MEIIFEININDKVGKRVQNNQWGYPKEKVLLWIDRANHRNGEKTYAPNKHSYKKQRFKSIKYHLCQQILKLQRNE